MGLEWVWGEVRVGIKVGFTWCWFRVGLGVERLQGGFWVDFVLA